MSHGSVTRFQLMLVLFVGWLPLGCSGQAPTSADSPHRENSAPLRPPTNFTPYHAPRQAMPDLKNAKPDFVMEPRQLTTEFKASNSDFLSKYSGKVIEISGKVQDFKVSSKEGDIGDLQLGPSANYSDLDAFECSDPFPMAVAMPGQTVTLRGVCGEYGVLQWKIVRVEGEQPPKMSAEQLAKDYQRDEEGTAKKYRGKYLVLTGQVQKVNDQSLAVLLTPAGVKPEIWCALGGLGWSAAERHGWLKKGETVRIIGEWLSDDPNLDCSAVIPLDK